MSAAATEPGTEGLSDDTFLGGAVRLLQPVDAYRAGLDAVMLAAAAPAQSGRNERVLDAGAGVGTVGLCIARRIPDAHLTLVEREPALADLARRNSDRNGLSDRVQVVVADVALGGAVVQGKSAHPDLAPASFDHVLANPPFHATGAGRRPASRLKAAAHLMAPGDLDRWVAFLATATRAGGSCTLIHRTSALSELLAALDGRFGGISIYPLFPHAGEPASRVIIQGWKGSRSPLILRTGLVLHADGHGFTPAAEAVLRHGAPLPIGP